MSNQNIEDLVKSTQDCIYSVYRTFNEETIKAYKIINEAKQKSEKTEFELALTLFNVLKAVKATVVLEYLNDDTELAVDYIEVNKELINQPSSISSNVLDSLSKHFEGYFVYNYDYTGNCAFDFTKES